MERDPYYYINCGLKESLNGKIPAVVSLVETPCLAVPTNSIRGDWRGLWLGWVCGQSESLLKSVISLGWFTILLPQPKERNRSLFAARVCISQQLISVWGWWSGSKSRELWGRIKSPCTTWQSILTWWRQLPVTTVVRKLSECPFSGAGVLCPVWRPGGHPT